MTELVANERITAAISAIICQTFRCLPQQVTMTTQADDIDGWDSLSHTVLLVAIERHFGLLLNYDEVYDVADVGGLVAHVQAALQARHLKRHEG